MNIREVLPLSLTLGCLGLAVSLASSLLVIFMPKTIIVHYVLLIILLVLAFICIFFAFFRNDDERVKRLNLFVGIVCILSGIVSVSLSHNFHFNASLVNRASVYFIIVLGLQASLTVWFGKLITALPFMNDLSAGLDSVELSILFVFVNTIISLCSAFTIAASQGSTDKIIKNSVAYTFGIWIASFVLNGGMAILICSKGTGSNNLTTNVVESNAEYDKIG
ncbi:hypothetical protein M9Y10_014176 [Tritrichomonas musculus]|uniref:Uncharacterized protein n=1 Tax=Tritrichomonas musculus TaxID=1915356 RepID=A0ABR2KYS5_9EUKA